MIYTLTFNPAIDYVMHFDAIETGKTNRSENEYAVIGGKGINVSVVLKRLGVPSAAMGFVAGFTGEAIRNELEGMGIKTDFVQLEKGMSRINVKVKTETETELNGKGPDISDAELTKLFEKLEGLKENDTLVLAGSIPKSLPKDIYSSIMEKLFRKGIRFVVDAEGELLLSCLKYKPYLIKPNHHELGALFGKTLTTHDEIILYAKKLTEMGAENVLVSMAEQGAILVEKSGATHFCPAAKGVVKNSVGAGDSMVAGFLAGAKNGDFAYALRLGSASGSATAFSEGLADKEDIMKLM